MQQLERTTVYRSRCVAHVIYSFGAGGIENGLVNLINRLDSRRYSHLVCCLTEAGTFAKRIQQTNVKMVALHKRAGNDPSVPIRLGRLFRRHAVDIVHLRGWATLVEGLIGVHLSHQARVVYGFHGKTFEDVTAPKKRRDLVERVVFPHLNGIFTLTDRMKNDLCRRTSVPGEKVTVIHNGVDTQKFRPHRRLGLTRNFLGLSDADFVVGCVGRLDAVKDFETLLRGFSRLAAVSGQARLLIVGDGPLRQWIESRVRAIGLDGRVVMAGFQTDTAPFYRMMDLYVQTSLYEGFSNTILEAMAMGLPIVATRVGGNPDIITDNVNGKMIAPGDDESLSDLMIRFWRRRDLGPFYGKNAIKTVDRRFRIEAMVENYDRAYTKLLMGSAQRFQ